MATATEDYAPPAYKETHPPKLDAVAASIWGDVRDNSHSLDSGRFTSLIKKALIAQEQAYTKCLQYYERTAKEAVNKHRVASRRAKTAETKNEELALALEQAKGNIDSLRAQVKRLQAAKK